MKLRTIGYEAATQAAVIDCLKRAGVEVLIDVRAVPSSRRAGFSKNILAASLAEAGIAYVHLKALGTPKAGRQAVRAGRVAEMETIYAAHLAEPQAQLELAKALEIAREQPAALLCYEANPAHCHRRIVAGKLSEAAEFEVEDLTP
ncbi:MAG TPA: DUF488 domain-containing protein [Caulobacteraceae bacterium]|jgi:uncharacterized protein (DUF488 family)